MDSDNALVSLRPLAERLKVSAAWLREEALAGRVPVLRAGRRLLFNARAVERALLDRAAHVDGAASGTRSGH